MFAFDLYDWKRMPGFRDSGRVPELLHLVDVSTDEGKWSDALTKLESCASDLGTPCALTPPLTGALMSLALRTTGAKRSSILSVVEELTCGRGAEAYTDEQKTWHRESVHELILGFNTVTFILETSTVEDAKLCVDLLAYCAEHFPPLRPRVRKYLAFCQERHPSLADEISAVIPYFAENAVKT
jgi:hypothetical protein